MPGRGTLVGSSKGAASTGPAPTYYGGGVWSAVQAHLKKVSQIGSIESLIVATPADSLTEGDAMTNPSVESYPAILNGLLQGMVKPGGSPKYAEIVYPGDLYGARAANANGLIPTATGGQGVSNARTIAVGPADANALAIYFEDGLNHVSAILDPDGGAIFQADVYAGDVRPAIPANGTATNRLSTFTTSPIYVTSYANDFQGAGYLHRDAAGNPYGKAGTAYVAVAENLSLAAQSTGCTVVLRGPGESAVTVRGLLVQRGGDPRNYVAVANEALWGSDHSLLWGDSTPNANYWPRTGGTASGDRRFRSILRHTRGFQNFASSYGSHAASKVLVLLSAYTNNVDWSTADAAAVAAEVAGNQLVRDEIVATGNFAAFALLPPTAPQSGQAAFGSFVAQTKAMMEGHPLSGWVSAQDLYGADRLTLENQLRVPSPRRDGQHCGLPMNRLTAAAFARPIAGDVLFGSYGAATPPVGVDSSSPLAASLATALYLGKGPWLNAGTLGGEFKGSSVVPDEGTGAVFPGGNGRVGLASSQTAPSASGDHTIFMRFKRSADAGAGAAYIMSLFGYEISGGGDNWQLRLGNDGTAGTLNKLSFNGLVSDSAIGNLNTWCDVAVVKSGTTVTFYLNGAQFGTTKTGGTGSPGSGAHAIGIGDCQDYNRNFAGEISHVFHWRGRALASTEVASLHASPGQFLVVSA